MKTLLSPPWFLAKLLLQVAGSQPLLEIRTSQSIVNPVVKYLEESARAQSSLMILGPFQPVALASYPNWMRAGV
ncbi:MAG: hypothetical protein CSA62_06035 [Planctomycetota bacterium]|nr:MAG: hypothetical protein CSA62_06035 [Planctomycetota bacterium]